MSRGWPVGQLGPWGYGGNVADLFTHKCSPFTFRKVIQNSCGLVKTPLLLETVLTLLVARLDCPDAGHRESGASLGWEMLLLTGLQAQQEALASVTQVTFPEVKPVPQSLQGPWRLEHLWDPA